MTQGEGPGDDEKRSKGGKQTPETGRRWEVTELVADGKAGGREGARLQR